MDKAATILKKNKDHLATFMKMEWQKRNDTRVNDIRYTMDSINNIKALEQRKNKLKEEVHSLKEERDYLLDNLGDIKRACC
jgi:hypothetical protein